MSIPEIAAGNIVESDITFAPADASIVLLANVTARVLLSTGDVVDATVTAGVAANKFHAEWTIPDDLSDGRCWFRWESNPPSAKIAVEDDTTAFDVVASLLPVP